MGNALTEILFKSETDTSYVDLMQFSHYRSFEEGIIECKDGELMAAWTYTGVDYESASDEHLNYISHRLNDIYRNLEKGWCMWTEALRMETTDYPAEADCKFPDSVSRMIDNERRKAVQEQEEHYETVAFVVLMYRPPSKATQKFFDSMIEDDSDAERMTLEDKMLKYFRERSTQFEGAMKSLFPMTRQKPYEEADGHTYCNFARLLHYCATGIDRFVRVPDPRISLDCLIAGQDFYPSFTPRVGDNYVAVISIEGVQAFTSPAMLAEFDQLPLRYRWSTRFIFMNRVEAVESLGKFRRKWNQKVVGFKDQLMQNPNPRIDLDAQRMVADADEARAETQSGDVNQGYYTSVFVLYSDNMESLEDGADFFKNHINELGFGGRIERPNATAAFLGSVPGNAYTNIAKIPISTANLADLLPVASAWPGEQYAPCPFYDDFSPPLIQAETAGSTPFRLNLHVGDVGHTLIIGPTGTGKSTLLALIAAQFPKYQDAQIFAFDKGMSMYAITVGMGGNHYEIGIEDEDSEDGMAEHVVMPLRDLDTAADVSWANTWVESCLTLQGVNVDFNVRNKISAAIKLLKDSAPETRTITELVQNIQDPDLREALKYYTVDGDAGYILDGDEDKAELSRINCFEVGELMGMDKNIILPTILYLFRRIEKSLDGTPTLIVLDEVWLLLENEVFRDMIREWLKVLRKANAAVVVATQSVTDAMGSGIIDVIVESCQTKILLPHMSVAEDTHRPFYKNTLGLNDREILLLSRAIPKKQYYYTSPLGKRLFELNLRPKTLAYVGTSSPSDIAALKQLIKDNPDHWRDAWVERASA